MEKRYMFLIVIFSFFGFFLFVGNKQSYAYDSESEDDFDINLIYSEDKNIFKNDLYSFLDLVDNSLFAMSSYSMSDNLDENYDFLTNFAISFILINEDVYNDEIITGSEYVYTDSLGNKYNTNKYVSVGLIYDITDSIFGKRDFLIINEQLNHDSDLIPLLLIKDNVSFMEIEEIKDFSRFANKYNVNVKYKDMDLEYIYVFSELDGRLVLNNVLVEE